MGEGKLAMMISRRGLSRMVGFTPQQMLHFRKRGHMPDLPEVDARYVDVLRFVKERLASGYRLAAAFKDGKAKFGLNDSAASLGERFIKRAHLAALFDIELSFMRKVSRGSREQFSYEAARRLAVAWVLRLAGVGWDESLRFGEIYSSRGPIHGGNLITIVDGRVVENPFERSERANCLVYAIVNIGATIQRVDDAFTQAERHWSNMLKSGVTADHGVSSLNA